jgi:hypothetical protein
MLLSLTFNGDSIKHLSVVDTDELTTRTLRSIADQAGAKDFQKFLDQIEKMT